MKLPLSCDELQLATVLLDKRQSEADAELRQQAAEATRDLIQRNMMQSSIAPSKAYTFVLKSITEPQRIKVEVVQQILTSSGKTWNPELANALYDDIADALKGVADNMPSRLLAGFGVLRMDKASVDENAPQIITRTDEHIARFLREVRRDLDILVGQAKVAQMSQADDIQLGIAMHSDVINVSGISDSLAQFRRDYAEPGKVAFIMMEFRDTPAHLEIENAVKGALKSAGITGLLARDKGYHPDVLPNIITYMHGSGFGIAVFERIETDVFNPNVSLEIGYMLALGKRVLLLKDKTLKSLHTDLVGKLYREFDPQSSAQTIPAEVGRWLSDNQICGEADALESD